MGERTGSRVLQWVWSYVVVQQVIVEYKSINESSKAL
ncbi:hypothetical protein CTRU02_215160 [Colletotrichum truncatum]|uniref:Uncharacterized protein n=1 Tax=Colletotrichum truncatum TaxID=5467 RepID=A0ACC3YDM8_COLTU